MMATSIAVKRLTGITDHARDTASKVISNDSTVVRACT